MSSLSTQAATIRKKLALFGDQTTDYDIVTRKTPQLTSLLEEVESFSVNCRKKIAGMSKDIAFFQGLECSQTNTAAEKKFLSDASKNVTVAVDDDILKLVLFPFIKNLSARTKEYITLLISDAVKEYFSCHKKPDYRHKNCVIVINSLYARPDQISDNDNVETAAVINALKHLLLTDDDGVSLSVYRRGAMSDRHETEIYLMEEHKFMVWLLGVVGTEE